MPEAEPAGMTIDDLARRSGLTARNIRAYQAKGLLPPPVLRGRVGIYDERHLARLRLIAKLQHQGFSLAGAAELLRAWEEGRSLGDVLGVEEELTAPWADEEAAVIDADDLVALFPDSAEAALETAVDMGLLEPRDDGSYLVPYPGFLRIGGGLAAIGIPLEAALEVTRKAQRQMNEVAADFVALFDRYLWQPFVEGGMAPEELGRLRDALHRLRPLAFEALATMFAVAMDREAETGTGARVIPTVVSASSEERRLSEH